MSRSLFVAALLLIAVVSATVPTFEQSFTTEEMDDMVMHQGQYEIVGDNFCCNEDSTCEVQTSSSSGKNYIDAENQRTRFDPAGAAQSTITFCGKVQKEMIVEDGKCIKYCPTNQGQTGPCQIGGFGIFVNATKSTGTLNGQAVNIYSWDQTAILNITMETLMFYTTSDDKTPLKLFQNLTPFGEAIGSQNQTWNSWTPGVPNAELFKVSNMDTCPQDPQCGSQSRQQARLRNGMYDLFRYYQYGPGAN